MAGFTGNIFSHASGIKFTTLSGDRGGSIFSPVTPTPVTPPTIGSFTPASGTISSSTQITFSVSDADSLLRVIVKVTIAGIVYEAYNNGLTPDFATGSSVTGSFAAGLNFAIKPNGGWPSGVSFALNVIAIDIYGNTYSV